MVGGTTSTSMIWSGRSSDSCLRSLSVLSEDKELLAQPHAVVNAHLVRDLDQPLLRLGLGSVQVFDGVEPGADQVWPERPERRDLVLQEVRSVIDDEVDLADLVHHLLQ